MYATSVQIFTRVRYRALEFSIGCAFPCGKRDAENKKEENGFSVTAAHSCKHVDNNATNTSTQKIVPNLQRTLHEKLVVDCNMMVPTKLRKKKA